MRVGACGHVNCRCMREPIGLLAHGPMGDLLPEVPICTTAERVFVGDDGATRLVRRIVGTVRLPRPVAHPSLWRHAPNHFGI